MAISVGDKIPGIDLAIMGESGPETVNIGEIFSGTKGVLFALPGAFTPTCSAGHLPGFLALSDTIKAKGVDIIACLSVNDAHVMGAWANAQNVGDKILMLADGNGDFTQAVGLSIDRTEATMGIRSQRYAMIIDEGIVTHMNLEVPGAFEISDAETILKLL